MSDTQLVLAFLLLFLGVVSVGLLIAIQYRLEQILSELEHISGVLGDEPPEDEPEKRT